MKKYSADATPDDKISKYKYGRQSNPIMAPEGEAEENEEYDDAYAN